MTGTLRLPAPPPAYNQRDQAELRRSIETFLSGVQGLAGAGSGGGVTAFNARTGAVTPLQADYDAFFLTPSEGNALYSLLGHTHPYTALTYSGLTAGQALVASSATAAAFRALTAADIGAGLFPSGGFTFPGSPLIVGSTGASGVLLQSNGGAGSNSPGLQMYTGGALRGLLAIAASSDDYLPGTVAGDSVLRTQGGTLFVTVDSGATAHVQLTSSAMTLKGTLLAGADSAYNIGASASGRFNDLNLGGALILRDAAGTAQKYLRMANAGDANGFYIGLEDSAGTFFGATAYQAVFYCPNLALKLHTPSVRITGRLDLAASIAGSAPLRIPHGTGPSAPENGDFWTTTVGLFTQRNSVTVAISPPRAAVVTTTASLANLATENGTVALAKTGTIIKVTADRACWVRLYGTTAERTADAARLITEDPTFDIPVLADLVFTATALTINCAPLIGVASRDGSPTTAIYYAVTNRSGSTSTVQFTVTHLPTEN